MFWSVLWDGQREKETILSRFTDNDGRRLFRFYGRECGYWGNSNSRGGAENAEKTWSKLEVFLIKPEILCF